MRTRLLTCALLVLLAGACKIDSTVYQPPGGDDDGDAATTDDAMPDAPPQGIYVIANPGTTTVSEGGQVTVRIKLSEAPPADRPIAVVGNAQLVPTPASVTFTPSNWMNERTIILAAGQDDDADDSPVTVLFDGMGDVGDGSAMVMITDDDTQILLVSPPSSIGVTEGASGQVAVQLAARPSASVVVSVASMETAVATASPATLTFTTSNWNVAQNVTVSGVQDVGTGNDTTLLILDPSIEGIPTHTVAINVTDDDILAIDASPGNLGTIVEGNSTGVQFGVRLTQMPGADVVVSLSASPSGPVNLSQSTLTFTSANYATMQNVTVTTPQDPNVVDEQVTIRLSATGLADRFVQASIDDNDTQVVQVTPNPALGVTEGAGGNFAVLLAFQPADNVIVNVGSSDTTVATVGTTQLTFTPTDYGTPQNVAINGVQDVDLANESATISFNAPAQGLTTNRTVNVTDDDTQVLDVAPLTIAVAEGGTNTYAVALSYQPSGNVVVTSTVAAANVADISALPTTLTFTPMNYATAQTVTVTGLEDADVTNETATVVVSSSGIASRNVTVNVSDNDSLGIVVTPAMVSVTEGGPSGTIMVSLAAMPASNVTVMLQTNPTGVVTLGSGSLTFTPANYATPQPVTVTGVQDGDGSDETTTIHLTAPSLDEKTVPVTVTDDDIIAPVLTPSPAAIEEGKSGIVSLTLSRDPGRAVTVDVLGIGFTDFEVQPTQFFFEQGNWDRPQSVDLFAYPDDEADDETEDVLFAIQELGTQTNLRVNIDDPTILLGFPPPHPGTPATVSQLEAWRDGQVPACYLLEKIIVDVASLQVQSSAMQVALYASGSGDTQPSQLLYSSGTFSVGPTAGLRIIDVQDTTIFNASPLTTWLAVETTSGVALKTLPTASSHCSRSHSFGNFMPNPFNAAGSGSGGTEIMDAGTSDSGTVNVTCTPTPPVAVWIVGREGCVSNPL